MCGKRDADDLGPLLESLRESQSEMRFEHDTAICYVGQVPNVCVCLLEGAAEIKRRQGAMKVEGPCFIGLERLLDQRPSSSTVVVYEGSLAFVIDRVTLVRIIEEIPSMSHLLGLASVS